MASVRNDRGTALVLVLWLLTIVSLFAFSHSRSVRIETRLTANLASAAAARQLAEAAIHRTAFEMIEGASVPVDGRVRRVDAIDGANPVLVRVQDARGLVDINSAPSDVLALLFLRSAIDADRVPALVDAILDWRDTDDLRRLNGAEAGEYRDADIAVMPRNKPFVSTDELRWVLGLGVDDFARVSPYLSTFANNRADPRFAPPELRRRLGLADPAEVATADRSGGIYHIAARVAVASGVTATVSAIVSIQPSDDIPFRILQWREAVPFGENDGIRPEPI